MTEVRKMAQAEVCPDSCILKGGECTQLCDNVLIYISENSNLFASRLREKYKYYIRFKIKTLDPLKIEGMLYTEEEYEEDPESSNVDGRR